MAKKTPDEMWGSILTGTHPGVTMARRLMNKLGSTPRCKVCASPFGRPWGPILRLVGKGRSAIHPLICTMCLSGLDRKRGGVEIELSLLFADVRGSTAMAEGTSAGEFSELLNHFYEISARVIDEEEGMVDKFLGDGVFALFIPGFTGHDHARHAIEAGRRLLAAATDPQTGETWIPIGVGVHSGTAYTGVVGASADMLDFTAVGDAVNVASRLGSEAGSGELLVSAVTADQARLDPSGFEQRHLRLEGRRGEIDALVLSQGPSSTR